MAYYTVGHELGHHVHGHTATAISTRDKLQRQAMEIEADGYSGCLAVRAALRHSSDPEAQFISIRLFFLAAALYLECDERTIDWRGFQTEDYPPYSIRIEYLQGAIQEGVRRFRPDNRQGLDNQSACELLEVLAGVWNPSHHFVKILRETEDLAPSVYIKYSHELQNARLRLREELKAIQLDRKDDRGKEAEARSPSDPCNP